MFRLGAAAKQTTLIEIVDDDTGAVKRLYKEKSNEKEPSKRLSAQREEKHHPQLPLSTLPEMTAHMNAPLLDPHQRDVKADVARMRSGAYHLDVVAIISYLQTCQSLP